jgi:hypothetical protein
MLRERQPTGSKVTCAERRGDSLHGQKPAAKKGLQG